MGHIARIEIAFDRVPRFLDVFVDHVALHGEVAIGRTMAPFLPFGLLLPVPGLEPCMTRSFWGVRG